MLLVLNNKKTYNFIVNNNKKSPLQRYVKDFQKKAVTYSSTISSTIGANRLNFSVRNGKR